MSPVVTLVSFPFAMVRVSLDLPVFFFMAVTDGPLVMTDFVSGVFLYVIVVMIPGLLLVLHYLIGMVQIRMISCGQRSSGDPAAIVPIDVSLMGNVIIDIIFR
jgi:hypothetical protein